MNRLFVAKKPIGVSSNHFLSRLKKKYNEKKAGFSGTLDPFAGGVLVVGMGQYTRLFNYLKKTPKIYQATIWLGAFCESGDNENITQIDILAVNEYQSHFQDKGTVSSPYQTIHTLPPYINSDDKSPLPEINT